MTNHNSHKTVGQAMSVLVAIMFVFAASALAQVPAVPGAPIYVIPVGSLATAPATTPVAPVSQCCSDESVKPTGQCCSAPLGKRLGKDLGELKDAEDAVAPWRGSTAPVSPASGLTGGVLPWLILLSLLGVGALIWAFLSLRRDRRQQSPVVPPAPVGPPASPAPTPIGPHIPIDFTAQPFKVTFGGGDIQLGVIQPAPAPGPAPIVPAPGSAPKGTPCPGCGTVKPTALARFCAFCGHALPAILFALLLFGFGHSAMAQGLPAGDYRKVDCPAGITVAQPICLQPVNAVPVMIYIPPTTGNGPSAIVPTVPPAVSAPAAPAAPRHRAARPASQPVARVLSPEERELTQAMIGLVKKIDARVDQQLQPQVAPAPVNAPAPAASPAPSAITQEMVNRLTAVEKKQGELAKAQNGLTDRFVHDEANITSIGNAVDDVNDLALKTAAGAIHTMDTHGGKNSRVCVAYAAFVRQGGTENPSLAKSCNKK